MKETRILRIGHERFIVSSDLLPEHVSDLIDLMQQVTPCDYNGKPSALKKELEYSVTFTDEEYTGPVKYKLAPGDNGMDLIAESNGVMQTIMFFTEGGFQRLHGVSPDLGLPLDEYGRVKEKEE